MHYLELQQVQDALPEYKVYAFKMKYYAELEVYRIELWTDHPVDLDDKYEFSFDVHPGLASTKDSLLMSIKTQAGRIVEFHRENTWKKPSH